MHPFVCSPVGSICFDGILPYIQIDAAYRPALSGLKGFGFIQVLWWFSGCDDPQSRAALTERRPDTRGPRQVGTFATRSPRRPNPLGLSCAQVLDIDEAGGVIRLAYIDADAGTPVLDIKPYTPSLDRVEYPQVPTWCAHWPQSIEQSGEFDWSKEFCF